VMYRLMSMAIFISTWFLHDPIFLTGNLLLNEP